MNILDIAPPYTDSPKWMAVSCSHSPLEDEDAVRWVEERLRALQPDYFFHLGDGLEAMYASRWPHVYDWDAEYEFVKFNSLLKRLRRAAPPHCRMVFLQGNHDANALSLLRLSKQVASLVDWRRHVPELAEDRWYQPTRYVYDREHGAVQLGQVTFAHGYAHGASYGIQSVTIGTPYGLTVLGHTHRPEVVTRAKRTTTVDLPYWYCNVGCLRTLKPDYTNRRFTGTWGHALAYGTAPLWRYMKGYIPTERLWTAKVEILRTGEGYPPELSTELS